MRKAVFSSRRSDLEPNQVADIEALLGRMMIAGSEGVWQATDSFDADLNRNKTYWERLFEMVGAKGVILGDFPHAALEALTDLDRSWECSRPSEYPTVWVRIYEIGGGFKRDTKYLRWARIF